MPLLPRPLKWTLLYLLPIVLLWAFVTYTATQASQIIADEGQYIMDAWLKYRVSWAHGGYYPQLINEGYFLGIPYLLFKEPGIYKFRLFSLIVFIGTYFVAYVSYLKYLNAPKWWGLMLAFIPAGLWFYTLNYHDLPVLFYFLSASCWLFALRENRVKHLAVLGALAALAMGASVIAYTLSMALIPVSIGLMAIFMRKKPFWIGVVAGAVLSIIWILSVTPISIPAMQEFVHSPLYGTLGDKYGHSEGVVSRALSRFGQLALGFMDIWSLGLLFLAGVIVVVAPDTLPKRLAWAGRNPWRLLLLLGLALLLIWDYFRIEQDGFIVFDKYYNPQGIFVAECLMPFGVWAMLRAIGVRNTLIILIAAFLPFTASALQVINGNMPLHSYFIYWIPAWYSLTFIAAWKDSVNWRLPKITRPVLVGAFIFIALFGIYRHYTYCIRNYNTIPGRVAKNKGLVFSEYDIVYYDQFPKLYYENGCDKRFFGVLGYMPYAYYILNLKPELPGWTAEKNIVYEKILHSHEHMCLLIDMQVYRDAAEMKAYIGIERKPKYIKIIQLHPDKKFDKIKDFGFVVLDK